MTAVLEGGADLLVRAGWRNARWLDAEGELVGLLAEFSTHATDGLLDRPIWTRRKGGPALALRLVGVRKSEPAAAEARRKARRQAQKQRCQVSAATVAAADWGDPRGSSLRCSRGHLAHPRELPDRQCARLAFPHWAVPRWAAAA